jgi:hypothetical protein
MGSGPGGGGGRLVAIALFGPATARDGHNERQRTNNPASVRHIDLLVWRQREITLRAIISVWQSGTPGQPQCRTFVLIRYSADAYPAGGWDTDLPQGEQQSAISNQQSAIMGAGPR